MNKTKQLERLHQSLNRIGEFIEYPEAIRFDPVWFADKIASVERDEMTILDVLGIYNESVYLLWREKCNN
jgi:hypothetical protein